MNLEQIVKETVAKIVAEKQGKDLTGDGKIDSADYLQARSNAIEKAKNLDEDYEVAMAQDSLDSIIRAAMMLKTQMGDNEVNLPAWIQDHITNSENYINQAAKGYHESDAQIANHAGEEDESMYEARFKKGEDVGGKGFEFKDIAKKAAKQYGSEEAGKRVAGAIMKKVLNKEGESQESNNDKIENIKNKLSKLGVKYELGGKHQPFKIIYKPINKPDEWYNKFDNIIDLYNLKSAVKTSLDEAFKPKSSFEDYKIGDNVTLAGKKAKITNMKMDDETGERRARVRFEDGTAKEVSINSLNESQELDEATMRRWQHYAGIK
jgi:hypothetical protein